MKQLRNSENPKMKRKKYIKPWVVKLSIPVILMYSFVHDLQNQHNLRAQWALFIEDLKIDILC